MKEQSSCKEQGTHGKWREFGSKPKQPAGTLTEKRNIERKTEVGRYIWSHYHDASTPPTRRVLNEVGL